MAKIYIDTNIFIGLYQDALDRIDTLDEIAKQSQHFITTSQTINEFHRNRITVINKLIKRLDESTKFDFSYPSLIRDLPECKELLVIRDQIKDKSSTIIKYLKLAKNINQDLVGQKIVSILNNPLTIQCSISNQLIEKAQQRKLLGNPPSSKDKITIGDEVIWEALLSNVQEDLIIVSRDQTYTENLEVLKTEFQHATRYDLILVTKKINEAFTKIGVTPSTELVKEEDRIDYEKERKPLGYEEEYQFLKKQFSEMSDNDIKITLDSMSNEAICKYRNDEGTIFDEEYYSFWKKYRALKRFALEREI